MMKYAPAAILMVVDAVAFGAAFLIYKDWSKISYKPSKDNMRPTVTACVAALLAVGIISTVFTVAALVNPSACEPEFVMKQEILWKNPQTGTGPTK